MSIIHMLREQHEVILSQLEILEDLAAGTSGHPAAATPLLDFFVHFADEQHHATEESELFPALRAAGLPSPGPVDVMLREHELGRGLIARMRAGLAVDDWPAFAAAARQYVQLLRDHIAKENEVLFHIAERLLDGHPLMG